MVTAQGPSRQRLNPVIELLETQRPVFGLYAPSNRRGRGGQPAADASPRQPIELARDALAYTAADYIFDGSMEGGLERGYAAFADFVRGCWTPAHFAANPLRV